MPDSVSMYHLNRGEEAFEQGNTLLALFHFEQLSPQALPPRHLSSFAYCVAREQKNLRRAVELCRQAIERDPRNPLHFLHLGRIYLLAKKKHLAIMTFRKGLKNGRDQRIIDELLQLGRRRAPVFPSLGRKHFINKYLGLVSERLGIL